MNIVVFDPAKHYGKVKSWWIQQNWPIIPLDFLSSFGLVVEDHRWTYAAGWLYLTNSKWALAEFLVVNPAAPLKSRAKGLELLVTRLCSEAQTMGAGAVFTSVQQKGLVKLLGRCGFSVADRGMTNVVRRF